jgi:Lrp/AsnC family transcriptional regulator for asnA, asnC and gidA
MKQIVDEKDKKILEILLDNSELSTHQISRKTLIPVTTVNNRIKKLKKLKVIKKFTIDIDNRKLGYHLESYILIRTSLKELKEVKMSMNDLIKLIRKNPDIQEINHITGDLDIILKMKVKDINELNDYVVNILSNYKGVEKTMTAMVLLTQ